MTASVFRWAKVAAALLGLTGAVVVLSGLGLRWDPFDLNARRLERARAEAEAARASERAAVLERNGERALQAWLAESRNRVAAADRATAVFMEQAGRADDANIPLDAARAARLGAHDRELCRIAADLDGCAAASDLAGDGAAALRPDDPAA